MRDISRKRLQWVARDGSTWQANFEMIARNRAENYKEEFDGDIEKSLREDTLPVFEELYEVQDWLCGNMNAEEAGVVMIKAGPELTADEAMGEMKEQKVVEDVEVMAFYKMVDDLDGHEMSADFLNFGPVIAEANEKLEKEIEELKKRGKW